MVSEPHITFHQLKSNKEAEFDVFYDIYANSLCLREQKPRTAIADLLTRLDYTTLLLKKNDQSIGFSILFTPVNEEFCLLEYMAIHADYRSFGLGGRLFERTFQDAVVKHGPLYGLLEVDSDREDCADKEIRIRRQRFYRQLGCHRINGLAYQLPLPGDGPPPQMDLLVYSPVIMPTISKRQLEHWLKTVYEQVYHCPSDDPRIDVMMANMPDPVKLA